VDGIVEVANVDHPHGHTDEGDDLEDGQSGGGVRHIDISLILVLFFYKMNK